MSPVQEMPSWRVRIGFVAAVFGMFMAILDIQIVASSLNEIQAGVSASQDEISWIQTSYLIAEIIMIPLAGVMMRIFSTRTAFVISSVGFTLASLGCALASSINELIVLRAIQGFMGGAMIPITQAVSFTIFPRHKMGSVQAVIGLVATIAPSIGPTLGGYITQHMSWHWLFLINVIPGILVSMGVWFMLDIDRADKSALKRLDLIGLVLMAIFLGSLEFVLEEGPDDDWFSSSLILNFALLCAMAGILFFWRVFTVDHPIVNLRLFRERNFATGVGLVFAVGVALYGLVYLLPLYFGTVREYNSMQIGEVMFVTGAAMFVMAPIVGRLTDVVDLRLLIGIGLLMTGIGSFMNVNLTTESGYWEFFWPQVVRGIGMIMCMVPTSRIALGNLSPQNIGDGSGMFSVMRNLGGAMGLALLDTVRDHQRDYHWTQLIASVNQGREVVVTQLAQYQQQFMGVVSDPQAAAIKMIGDRVATQAEVLAFNDIFLWLGILYLVVFPAVFLFKKPT
ncbi:DHA2 family efflux MFS transporter permease subunit [Larsenimonas salina]|uniref:DHA2 family efflux MFS transporter permease subunit n=1 Tax=Larsenimonas salina TaxID=1295565 RepID=UPI0020733B89|nr:DHA2 family efflux MFS transporter permease subunit [Larsenimonas salina]MCM5704051.1 DHA2 family efflux MFS transporter permease subunit [Larsenimonas salina]